MSKVLIVSYEFPPAIGGAGMVAYSLARNLIKEGCEVTIMTVNRKFPGVRYPEEKLHYIFVKKYWKYWFIDFAIKLKTIKYSNFDHVIVNDIGASLAAMFSYTSRSLVNYTIILHGNEESYIYKSPKHLFRLSFFRSKYTFEVFLKSDTSLDQAVSLKNDFLEDSLISSVNLIGKEESAKIFYEEFGEDIIEIFLNEKERLKKNEQKGQIQDLSDDGTKGESQMFLRYKEWNSLSPDQKRIEYQRVYRNPEGTHTARMGERDPSSYQRKSRTHGLRITREFKYILMMEFSRYTKEFQRTLVGVAQGKFRKLVNF